MASNGTSGASGAAAARAGLLAVRFGLELATLAALAVGGWRAGGPSAVRWALAVGAPLAAALVWGSYAAPKAPRRLRGAAHVGVEVLVFGAGVAALALTGLPGWAWALGVAHVVDRVGLALLEPRAPRG